MCFLVLPSRSLLSARAAARSASRASRLTRVRSSSRFLAAISSRTASIRSTVSRWSLRSPRTFPTMSESWLWIRCRYSKRSSTSSKPLDSSTTVSASGSPVL